MTETGKDKVYRAILRFARISASKTRLCADLVRGLPVNRALHVLHLHPRRGSFLIRKVLASAIANASQGDTDVNVNRLFVKGIWVDHAGLLHGRMRFRPGPMGRAMPIRRRLAHITVVVAEKPRQGSEE